MRLVMSGATYSEAVECSDVPRQEDWPKPSVVKRGKGKQFIYEVTPEQADLIKSHVLDVFECREGYEDAAKDRATLRRDLRAWGVLL